MEERKKKLKHDIKNLKEKETILIRCPDLNGPIISQGMFLFVTRSLNVFLFFNIFIYLAVSPSSRFTILTAHSRRNTMVNFLR